MLDNTASERSVARVCKVGQLTGLAVDWLDTVLSIDFNEIIELLFGSCCTRRNASTTHNRLAKVPHSPSRLFP